MPLNIFRLLGVLGLIFIIVGVLVKRRKRKLRDILYILGGIALAAYSIYIRDTIFIILQVVFTLVAIYDFSRQK